ncbi:hypothetical protein [Mycobacteroides abscessus]|uniref:hypothetical protein n=1 Tax=Mycobacteroides abscessus TaxID=36809 RepID=UPI00092B7732|nr:hypothetical protein [Mycobacteroides abscessus]SHQ55829.1 Uncharacterised protein [Mycobacteroides abscessus subsp. abscessus]SHQ56075.1 Uncharacterised protein [Mycobacteroides abscessus subsp. abscessus]SHQ96330.1 Uncharacterised protein [Mycobacteroides abscessus subsp. abscessus]SHR08670.1 Uncharacterised protein [Mycobacteroides abscessus subsp. abscessus]SHR10874.1 Uncharacterised protein [Mycobacteroides abscessus subsp. abscessus]
MTIEERGDEDTVAIRDPQSLAETIDAFDALAKDDPAPRILELLKLPAATDGSSTNTAVIEIVKEVAAEAIAGTKELRGIVEQLREWSAAEIGADQHASAEIKSGRRLIGHE